MNLVELAVSAAAVAVVVAALVWTRNQVKQAMATAGRKRRKLTVLQEQKQCESCRWWDHAEGQAARASHAPFDAVTRHVSVQEMARTPKLDDEGNPLPAEEQPPSNIPSKVSWDDLGACMHPDHHEGTFRVYSCDDWRFTDDQDRLDDLVTLPQVDAPLNPLTGKPTL